MGLGLGSLQGMKVECIANSEEADGGGERHGQNQDQSQDQSQGQG